MALPRIQILGISISPYTLAGWLCAVIGADAIVMALAGGRFGAKPLAVCTAIGAAAGIPLVYSALLRIGTERRRRAIYRTRVEAVESHWLSPLFSGLLLLIPGLLSDLCAAGLTAFSLCGAWAFSRSRRTPPSATTLECDGSDNHPAMRRSGNGGAHGPGDILVRLFNARSSLWADCLRDVPHDLYHLLAYNELYGRYRGFEPIAFCARDECSCLFVPLRVRRLARYGRSDHRQYESILPLGLSGPVWASQHDSRERRHAFVASALRAMHDQARTAGLSQAAMTLHPLFTLPPDGFASIGSVSMVGEAAIVDLANAPAGAWSGLEAEQAAELHGASADGWEIVHDVHWRLADAFHGAYKDYALDVLPHADAFYPREFFECIRHDLGAALNLWCVVKNGQFAGGAIVAEVQGLAHYYLFGARQGVPMTQWNERLARAVALWAHRRNNRWFYSPHPGTLAQAPFARHSFRTSTRPIVAWHLDLGAADPA